MKMTTIRIDQIDPNPYRDFGIYPINQEQIEALKTSFATRDFGIIAVRPMGNRYQQVYGHHRIEALRQMGITTIDAKVEMIDDDQMVKEMSAENATQQGNSFPAQVDSVAAIIRRLAYWLLISEDAEKMSAIADIILNQAQFGKAKSELLSGNGLGQRLISDYSPSLKRQVVDGAIAAENLHRNDLSKEERKVMAMRYLSLIGTKPDDDTKPDDGTKKGRPDSWFSRWYEATNVPKASAVRMWDEFKLATGLNTFRR